MIEVKGNLFHHHKDGSWIVITTNGYVKRDGCAVMGAGVAKQAARLYPNLPAVVGKLIKERDNHVHPLLHHRIFTFPVKHNWWEEADVPLIKRSLEELVWYADEMEIKTHIFMPRPGCGNGKLKWEDIKPLMSELDDRFTVVELYG